MQTSKPVTQTEQCEQTLFMLYDELKFKAYLTAGKITGPP